MPRVRYGVPTAKKTARASTTVKIHNIHERSQKRISNHAMRQNMLAPSVPVFDFAEEHVFQVGCAGRESVTRWLLAEHMDQRPSAHQLVGDHAEALLVVRQFDFFDRPLPYLARSEERRVGKECR